MKAVRVWPNVLTVVRVPMMLGHAQKPMTLMNLLFLFSNMPAEIIKWVWFWLAVEIIQSVINICLAWTVYCWFQWQCQQQSDLQLRRQYWPLRVMHSLLSWRLVGFWWKLSEATGFNSCTIFSVQKFYIEVSKLRGCDLHREVMNIPFDFYYGTCGVFNLGIDVALLCFYYNDWKGCWR